MDEFVDCYRCGSTFLVSRKRRKLRMLCESCRYTKSNTVQSGEHKCLPWHGHFGDDMTTPIDEKGNPVLPGIRICGKLDCVNADHVKGQ